MSKFWYIVILSTDSWRVTICHMLKLGKVCNKCYIEHKDDFLLRAGHMKHMDLRQVLDFLGRHCWVWRACADGTSWMSLNYTILAAWGTSSLQNSNISPGAEPYHGLFTKWNLGASAGNTCCE